MNIGITTTTPMHMMEIMNMKNPFVIRIKDNRRDWIGIIITSCIMIGKLIASWTEAVKLLFNMVWKFLIIGSCGCNCEFRNMFNLLIWMCDILRTWLKRDSLKFLIWYMLSNPPSTIADTTFKTTCFIFSITSALCLVFVCVFFVLFLRTSLLVGALKSSHFFALRRYPIIVHSSSCEY